MKEKIKIAVVEDDANVRQLMCFKLNKDGFECVEFVDGEDFLVYVFRTFWKKCIIPPTEPIR